MGGSRVGVLLEALEIWCLTKPETSGRPLWRADKACSTKAMVQPRPETTPCVPHARHAVMRQEGRNPTSLEPAEGHEERAGFGRHVHRELSSRAR